MNDNTITMSARLFAIAAAVAFIASSVVHAGSTGIPAPQSVQASSIAASVAHMGPGTGSVKTAPYAWIANAPSAPATVAPARRMGPGAGSSKSPSNR
jgi:hypothetical protein